jgi:hypothetical protein
MQSADAGVNESVGSGSSGSGDRSTEDEERGKWRKG